MTGLSVNRTSSCHSANAKLTMKISKTEHTQRCFDRGWTNTQGVAGEVTKRRPNRVRTPQTPETTCRSLLPSHSHWLSLTLTHSQHSAWSRASVRLIAGFSAADSDSDSNSVLGGTFGINTSASELSSTFVIPILLQATRCAICSVKGLFAQLYRRSWYSSQYTRAQHVPENICASDF